MTDETRSSQFTLLQDFVHFCEKEILQQFILLHKHIFEIKENQEERSFYGVRFYEDVL